MNVSELEYDEKVATEYSEKIRRLPDFSKADYTAIISDLHLCEEEPINSKYPLWKKYKTRQFFFDDQFKQFLDTIVEKANGEMVELVLNGDIFDFDSVCARPKHPPYRLSWLEKRRGLFPHQEKSVFKIKKILNDHPDWVAALREFVLKGHRAIFVVGNHDVELHFQSVQQEIHAALDLPEDKRSLVRFTEWFYISNGDTLIEHGNQYDPYCVAQDPINPFIHRFNRTEVRIPFGNLATRYLINGMGFFNPHLDSNFIMSPKEYVVFFFKYMLRAQPLLLLTWFFGSILILIQSFVDRLKPSVKEPLRMEDKVNWIASKANASPRMVRELKELFVPPAASDPFLIARELWLDRAFLLLIAFFIVLQVYLFVNNVIDTSFLWFLIPFMLFLPFFMFYSKSVYSDVEEFKEPKEKILSMASMITKVERIVFGHTHIVRHEIIGPVEHLNSGTWSPAFKDVECEEPIDLKTYVWISKEDSKDMRSARVLQYKKGEEFDVFSPKTKKKVLV